MKSREGTGKSMAALMADKVMNVPKDGILL